MEIGILGGTGNMGRGLTIRLALRHDILVGSRSFEKAGRIAKSLNNVAKGFYLNEMEGTIEGVLNADAIKGSEATGKVLEQLRKTKDNQEFLATLGR